MILQTVIFPDSRCPCEGIYYQSNLKLIQQNDGIIIPEKQRVSFFSYINMFDAKAWHKYTMLSNVYFNIEVKGKGTVFLKSKTENKEQTITEYYFANDETDIWQRYSYEIDLEKNAGCYYFEIKTESDMEIRNAKFETDRIEPYQIKNQVQLALNICTFHRKEEIQRNLKQLRESRFFRQEDELFQKLNIVIVDNGSELQQLSEPYIKIVHNPNTGGSGGFKRGLEELRKRKFNITHVVFMDDDVQFFSESLYRLFALLSFMKEEYLSEPIAGRMFRTDKRHIQYTAAEIWNKGDLQHIGWNADMTLETEILSSNNNEDAEYGGWWFCCYPMEFAAVNDPLPFFLHCDDVEYGLRHGGTPIILNGIQVWHETYEYRQSPIMTYYDTRNPLIVNMIHFGYQENIEDIIYDFKAKISEKHVQCRYLEEYMVIKAFWHFARGWEWFLKKNDSKVHENLRHYKRENKIFNAIAWRMTVLKLKIFKIEDKIIDAYTIYFNEPKGVPCGILKMSEEIPVTVEFENAPKKLDDDWLITFNAVQETFNDVLLSMSENNDFEISD